MLLIEDNGGGMDMTTIRKCMSFEDPTGQHGNSFRAAAMRLGADVLVLTKSKASDTCSAGMLSCSYLSKINAQEVIVPIVDYSLGPEIKRKDMELPKDWEGKLRLIQEWDRKLKLFQEWSPFQSEAELLSQFDDMPAQVKSSF